MGLKNEISIELIFINTKEVDIWMRVGWWIIAGVVSTMLWVVIIYGIVSFSQVV